MSEKIKYTVLFCRAPHGQDVMYTEIVEWEWLFDEQKIMNQGINQLCKKGHNVMFFGTIFVIIKEML